jgi:predicted cupin superfamily sugar epimerase
MRFGPGMNVEVAQLIAQHGLQPLPWEGGYFRRTWTSQEAVRGSPGRPAGTAILYLMTTEGFSALHLLDAGELWRFQSGDPVEHLRLDPRTGTVQLTVLGPDTRSGQERQLVVPAGVWQAARPMPGGPKGWSLIEATMTPGWAEGGFTLGRADELGTQFPEAAALIQRYTR